MKYLKMQDLKMKDQMSGHENAGPFSCPDTDQISGHEKGPAFSAGAIHLPQNITSAVWRELISRPTDGRRLSWPSRRETCRERKCAENYDK